VESNGGNSARRDPGGGSKEMRTGMGEGWRNRGSRTLPYPEYVKRREEGQCFHCGGAYSYWHRCPDKNLRVVICGENEEEEETKEQQWRECEDDEQGERSDLGNRELVMNLSVLSTSGLTPPQTMKLRGEVRGRKIMVLINSGASHNFISTALVCALGIPKEYTPTYKVKLGDGHRK